MKYIATNPALVTASATNPMTIGVLPMPSTLTRPTSSAVSTASAMKMIRYSFLFAWADMARSVGDEVDEGEYQDPDQVHEVPEQAEHLDAVVVAVVVFPHRRSDRHDRDVGDAGKHMQAVEARDDEEGRRAVRHAEDQAALIQARLPQSEEVDPELVVPDPEPFLGLAAKEK